MIFFINIAILYFIATTIHAVVTLWRMPSWIGFFVVFSKMFMWNILFSLSVMLGAFLFLQKPVDYLSRTITDNTIEEPGQLLTINGNPVMNQASNYVFSTLVESNWVAWVVEASLTNSAKAVTNDVISYTRRTYKVPIWVSLDRKPLSYNPENKDFKIYRRQ